GGDVPMTDVRAHLAMVQDRYLATTSVQRMAAHLRLTARLPTVPVATELFHHPDLGSSDLVVVTRDVPGLFSLIAGTLAAHGVNIISAQIATPADRAANAARRRGWGGRGGVRPPGAPPRGVFAGGGGGRWSVGAPRAGGGGAARR